MKGGTWIATFGATAVVVALSLLTSIILARHLGPEGRGILLAMTFWPAMLSALLNLSINEATMYHVARARVSSGPRAAQNYGGAALLLQTLVAIAVTLLSLLLLPIFFWSNRSENLATVLSYAALFTPLCIGDLHFKATLQGRGEFHALNIVRLCQPVGYAIALAALVLITP